MTRECSFILSNRRKCRCAATRNQALCRHHAPKPAVPGPPPIPKSERYSDLIRWRRLGSNLQWMPVSEIPHAIYEILECLVDRGEDSTGRVSDLTAGRFLRALLTRLGHVPFPDPDLALPTGPALAYGPPMAPTAYPAAPIDPEDYAALMAGLAPHLVARTPPTQQPAAPSSRASFHQWPDRVNQ